MPEKLASTYIEQSHTPEINFDCAPLSTINTNQQLILLWKKIESSRFSFLGNREAIHNNYAQPHRVSQTVSYVL